MNRLLGYHLPRQNIQQRGNPVKTKSFVTACVALCGALLLPVFAQAAAPAPRAGGPPAAGPPAVRPPGVPGATQKPMVSCQRGGLQHAVGLYLAAQAAGDISGLPLATGLGYFEDMKAADVKTGFLTKKKVIARSVSLYDDQSCQTYTEIWVTDQADPWVAGIRMRINHDKIAEINVITTTTGDWGFNVDNFLKYSSDQDWSPIPVDRRDSYGTLVQAANAYLDAFLEAKIDLVPWGYPCERIEGGMFTGRNSAQDTCEAGVPSGVNIANRSFVVDTVVGGVVAWCTFGAGGPTGGSGAPDAHMFRLNDGKIRYVHTITHLKQASFRGGGGGPGAGGPGAGGRAGGPGGAPARGTPPPAN
jgi:hypothetical protein